MKDLDEIICLSKTIYENIESWIGDADASDTVFITIKLLPVVVVPDVKGKINNWSVW